MLVIHMIIDPHLRISLKSGFGKRRLAGKDGEMEQDRFLRRVKRSKKLKHLVIVRNRKCGSSDIKKSELGGSAR